MFNPATSFTENQLGRYNSFRFYFGSQPNLTPTLRPIGDLNNDGYDDLEISVPNNQKRYIFFGFPPGNIPRTSEGFTSAFPDSLSIDLDRPSPRFSNDKPYFEEFNSTNRSFEIGQDINDDGLKELFVRNGDLPTERQNYVLFGEPNGFNAAEIFADPEVLDGKKGFYLPPTSSPRFNASFDGDVNGDGIIDLSFNDIIFFGTREAFPGVLSPDLLNGSNGFQVKNGTSPVTNIANLGDINSDGRSDLVIGNTFGDLVISSHILTSPPSFPATIDVSVPILGLTTELTSSNSRRIQVRPLGDITRDNFDDFAVVEIDPWSSTSGRSRLFYGGITPFEVRTEALSSYGIYDTSDFNNDGITDLLLSQSVPPGARFNGSSTTYISFITHTGGRVVMTFFSTPVNIGESSDLSGGINIGDFNGDYGFRGHDDVGIDDIYIDNKIIFGGSQIRGLTDEEVNSRNGIIIGQGFTSVGDVNGDDRTDLARGGYVLLGNSIVFKDFGGGYNHFEYPDFIPTNFDSLIFTASSDSPDWVYGGWGNDTLIGRSEQMNQFDQFSGGPGRDQFVLNNEYGLQIGRGFVAVWDFDKGIDKVVVHGTANDYFFVEDNNTWLDNSNATFLRHRETDTSATVNTILARSCNCEFGAVLIGAFSDVSLDISDLVFVPNTAVI